MGYNIGVRLVEDFLARTNSGKCQDFRDTAEKIQLAFKVNCIFQNYRVYSLSCYSSPIVLKRGTRSISARDKIVLNQVISLPFLQIIYQIYVHTLLAWDSTGPYLIVSLRGGYYVIYVLQWWDVFFCEVYAFSSKMHVYLILMPE